MHFHSNTQLLYVYIDGIVAQLDEYIDLVTTVYKDIEDALGYIHAVF